LGKTLESIGMNLMPEVINSVFINTSRE